MLYRSKYFRSTDHKILAYLFFQFVNFDPHISTILTLRIHRVKSYAYENCDILLTDLLINTMTSYGFYQTWIKSILNKSLKKK